MKPNQTHAHAVIGGGHYSDWRCEHENCVGWTWQGMKTKTGAEFDHWFSLALRLQRRLDLGVGLAANMPVLSAESGKFTARYEDYSAIVKVLKGETDPKDWVSVYCMRSFGHSAHHWVERDSDGAVTAVNYCDGEVL